MACAGDASDLAGSPPAALDAARDAGADLVAAWKRNEALAAELARLRAELAVSEARTEAARAETERLFAEKARLADEAAALRVMLDGAVARAAAASAACEHASLGRSRAMALYHAALADRCAAVGYAAALHAKAWIQAPLLAVRAGKSGNRPCKK